MVLNLCLALIALGALGVAWFQLRVQRNTAGGRGILLGAGRTGHRTVSTVAGRNHVTDHYRVEVRLAGPGIWHELSVDLEKDGREFKVPDRPDRRRSMNSESPPIRWDFDLTPQDGDRVWCLVTWAEPRGPALRAGAFSMPVRGGSVYQWKWFPGSRYVGLVSEFASLHGPDWFRSESGAHDRSVDGASIAGRLFGTAMGRSDSESRLPQRCEVTK
jgi:hypothetical protein